MPRTAKKEQEPLVQNVARRVAELRDAAGLTQQGLADRLGVTLRYVQSVESGARNLSIRSLARFARVLKVQPAALLEPATTRRRPPGRPRGAK